MACKHLLIMLGRECCRGPWPTPQVTPNDGRYLAILKGHVEAWWASPQAQKRNVGPVNLRVCISSPEPKMRTVQWQLEHGQGGLQKAGAELQLLPRGAVPQRPEVHL